MPAHNVLISPAQGLPACCATATESDSSSAANITSPDRIPAILDSSEIQKGLLLATSALPSRLLNAIGMRAKTGSLRSSFDHLVRASQKRRGHVDAKRTCGL